MRRRARARIGLAAILVLAACSAEPHRRRRARPARPSRRPRSRRRPPSRTRRSRPSPSAGRSKASSRSSSTATRRRSRRRTSSPSRAAASTTASGSTGSSPASSSRPATPARRRTTAPFARDGTAAAPGYEFEIEPPAEGLDYVPYSVAMANNTQTNDSQFFVSLVDLTGRLDLLLHDLRPGRDRNRT